MPGTGVTRLRCGDLVPSWTRAAVRDAAGVGTCQRPPRRSGSRATPTRALRAFGAPTPATTSDGRPITRGLTLLGTAVDGTRRASGRSWGRAGRASPACCWPACCRACRQGALPGSAGWLYLEPLVPGAHPLEALTIALGAALPGSSLRAMRDDLDGGAARPAPAGATAWPAGRPGARGPGGRPVRRAVHADGSTRTSGGSFIDLLVTAVTEPGGPVLALLTLRADFYDRPMAYPALGALLEAAQHHRSCRCRWPSCGRRSSGRRRCPTWGSLRGRCGRRPAGRRARAGGGAAAAAIHARPAIRTAAGHLLTAAAYRAIGGARGRWRGTPRRPTGLCPTQDHRALGAGAVPAADRAGGDRARHDAPPRRPGRAGSTRSAQTQLLRAVVDAFVAARLLVTGHRRARPRLRSATRR